MANVLQHHINFEPRPVSHAPSPFGFGFALGSNPSLNPVASSSWGSPPPTPGHTNVAAFHQLASSMSQSSSRMNKRRHDEDEDTPSPGPRDQSMDRSPTPERPKRAAPKRARLVSISNTADKGNSGSEDNRAATSSPDEVDVGVLLGSFDDLLSFSVLTADSASLPPQNLLPLFMNLLKAKPSLKSDILSLIPKPTIEIAVQAIEEASKKLREAYPYSNTPSTSVSFGFGSALSSSHSSSPHSNPGGGMRDAYIISRIESQITEFVSCCMSYLPYFTANPSTNPQPPSGSQLAQTIQLVHKQNSHPSETFHFLAKVMDQVMSQPSLAISSIAPQLFPRLQVEWNMWVDGIDDWVNNQGGMYGSEAVRTWERMLDQLAESRAEEVSQMMRPIRDRWVARVGWLVGRRVPHSMDQ